MPRALEPGSSISHYRVESALGAGGMGEVYKAQDTNLDRAVALKILPPELVRNDDRVRRFIQEAKSASSLNHPHIVTIHEIGRADVEGSEHPIHFIAMELVDGLTLKAKIHNERTDLKTLLSYLAQAADGLAKAHSAGIIHRDLKPENIMITRDGYAKVLDFGLAKLSIRKGAEGGTNAATQERDQTREGSVLGTVAYMSPEQVQGKVVDHRSDIFSFGCILYEAATRQKAFDADSDIDVMHKIVHDKPAAVDTINPEVPAELRRMIRRCLTKDPDKRYQSMKDIGIELADIVEEFDELSTSATSGSISVSSPSVSPLRRRTTWIGVAAAALLVAVIGIVEWRRTRSAAGPTGGALQSMRLQKVTNSGNVSYGAISPDGRYLAYVIRDESLQNTLVVRQVATGSEVKLVGPSPNSIARPSFSSDSNYVYYSHYDRQGGGGIADLFQIPALGGDPKKVLHDIDTAVTFSGDGKQLAFGRGLVTQGKNQIFVAAPDGSGERVIAESDRVSPVFVGPVEAAWSPDGKSVVTALASIEGGPHDEVTQIDVATLQRHAVGPRWFKVWDVAWMPDGHDLVISGVDKQNSQPQLWLQPFPEGQPRRITNDLNLYQYVDVTSDGKTLITKQSTVRSRLFSVAPGDAKSLQPITAELPDQSVLSVDSSSRGRVVYSVASGTRTDIWTVDPPAPPKQVTTDGASIPFARISADGTTIFFTSARGGDVPHIWKMDADGSNARQMTNGKAGEVLLAVSGDGSSFVAYDFASSSSRLQGSRGARTIVKGPPHWCAFSPDGRSLAYSQVVGNLNYQLVVEAIDGGKRIVGSSAKSDFRDVSWTPKGDAVTYSQVNAGAREVWKQPLDGSPPQQLTHVKNAAWQWYAWLPDGKLALARQDSTSDVVLISDFR